MECLLDQRNRGGWCNTSDGEGARDEERRQPEDKHSASRTSTGRVDGRRLVGAVKLVKRRVKRAGRNAGFNGRRAKVGDLERRSLGGVELRGACQEAFGNLAGELRCGLRSRWRLHRNLTTWLGVLGATCS
jgi:hypothetical protein